jgi:hypothetical protein
MHNPDVRRDFTRRTLLRFHSANGNFVYTMEIIDDIMLNPTSIIDFVFSIHALFQLGLNHLAFETIERGFEFDPFNRHLVWMAIENGIELDMREEAHRAISRIIMHQPTLIPLLDLILDPEITLDDF